MISYTCRCCSILNICDNEPCYKEVLLYVFTSGNPLLYVWEMPVYRLRPSHVHAHISLEQTRVHNMNIHWPSGNENCTNGWAGPRLVSISYICNLGKHLIILMYPGFSDLFQIDFYIFLQHFLERLFVKLNHSFTCRAIFLLYSGVQEQ